MKRSRLITAGIVLLAAAISCVASYVERVTFGTFVKRLALTVVIFIVVAFIIEIIIDWNFKPKEEEKPSEETEETDDSEQGDIENFDADEAAADETVTSDR